MSSWIHREHPCKGVCAWRGCSECSWVLRDELRTLLEALHSRYALAVHSARTLHTLCTLSMARACCTHCTRCTPSTHCTLCAHTLHALLVPCTPAWCTPPRCTLAVCSSSVLAQEHTTVAHWQLWACLGCPCISSTPISSEWMWDVEARQADAHPHPLRVRVKTQ